MARTMWFQCSNRIAPTTTVAHADILGDLFEAGEITEYTILKIHGWIKWIGQTVVADGTNAGVGLRIQDDGATAPTPLVGNGAIGAQDSTGFWMWKDQASFEAEDDEVTQDYVRFEVNSRRVVRETEELVLVHEGSASGQMVAEFWMRILILLP